MKPKVVVIDYGMGNLSSVEKALEKVGCEVEVTDKPSLFEKARGIVLPGVGSFRDCMFNLQKKGLIGPILNFINSGRPFLGICLGMQVLFSRSEEFGECGGLGVLKGKVVRFPKNGRLKIPHMGWNSLKIVRKAPFLKDIEDGSYFYFVHSFYVVPKQKEIIATLTSYGIDFASSIWKDNIFACQFHPEKSQKLGLKLLANFKEILENACQANNTLP